MKLLLILLAVLLAISIYFNIKCDWGDMKPGEIEWNADSVNIKDLVPTKLALCLINANADTTCADNFKGMAGGSIEFEKLIPMLSDTSINCLSYSFAMVSSSGTNELDSLVLIFHGNRYEDDGGGRMYIKYIPGPSYASDWMCPTICPN